MDRKWLIIILFSAITALWKLYLIASYKTIITISSVIALDQIYWALSFRIQSLPTGPSLLVYILHLVCRHYDDASIGLGPTINKIYGKNGIISMPWIGRKQVIITSSTVAKLVLQKKHTMDRPVNGLTLISALDDTVSFLQSNGSEWVKRRKLAASVLMRMCTAKVVNKLLDEALTNVVLKKLDKLCDEKKLWYPASFMEYCAFNTIFYANYGKHISCDDPLYMSMLDIITKTYVFTSI